MMGDEDAAGGRGITASKAAYGSKDYYPTVAELVNADERKRTKMVSNVLFAKLFRNYTLSHHPKTMLRLLWRRLMKSSMVSKKSKTRMPLFKHVTTTRNEPTVANIPRREDNLTRTCEIRVQGVPEAASSQKEIENNSAGEEYSERDRRI